MKRLSLAALILTLTCLAVPAGADPADGQAPPAINTPSITPGEVAPTPEMWFYQQYRQEYKNPQAMVRKTAEMKHAERNRRLASQQWFGISNQRPRAYTDPYNGDYGASWSSGNYYSPMQWTRPAATVVIVPHDKQQAR